MLSRSFLVGMMIEIEFMEYLPALVTVCLACYGLQGNR
jgi:hypothetical protein